MLLGRLLAWYIEKRFESLQHFLQTLTTVEKIIASKNTKSSSHQYYLRGQTSLLTQPDDLNTLILLCGQQNDDGNSLVQAADLVTRLGPIDDQSIRSYVTELTNALIDIRITRSFFSKEYKSNLQQMIWERLGYYDSHLPQEFLAL